MGHKIKNRSTKVWLRHTSTDFKIISAGGGE